MPAASQLALLVILALPRMALFFDVPPSDKAAYSIM
jgi:hypothetical protein